MDFIKIQNLSKIYTIDKNPFYALNNINLEIPTNKITVIIGKSGSGKTTLLNIINGLTPKNGGSITIPPSLKIATVFQEARLLPWLTIAQNACFWVPTEDPRPLLQDFGLLPFQSLYPHEISGGMAQRVALIRALLYKTSFILMDEPFSSLDYFMRLEMQEKILSLHKTKSLGIIFITHNVDEAIALGDEIIILEEGLLKEKILNPLSHKERVNNDNTNQLKKHILTQINYKEL